MKKIEIRRVHSEAIGIGQSGAGIGSRELGDAHCLADCRRDALGGKIVRARAAFALSPVDGNSQTAILLSLHRFEFAEPDRHAQPFVMAGPGLGVVGTLRSGKLDGSLGLLGERRRKPGYVHGLLLVRMRQQF